MGGGVSASGGELGLNERAWQIADAMAKNAAALRVAVRQLPGGARSEEHTSELQSRGHLVCRLLLEKKKEAIPTLRTRPRPDRVRQYSDYDNLRRTTH